MSRELYHQPPKEVQRPIRSCPLEVQAFALVKMAYSATYFALAPEHANWQHTEWAREQLHQLVDAAADEQSLPDLPMRLHEQLVPAAQQQCRRWWRRRVG